MRQNQNINSSLISTGYIISFMPLLIMPIIFTPLGFIIGCINITRDRFSDGLLQILLAVGCGIIGAHIGGGGLGLPKLEFH